jgi:PKD repeat protein
MLFCAVMVAMPSIGVGQAANARAASHRPDELLVKLRPQVSEARGQGLLRGHGARRADRFPRPKRLRAAAIDRWWHVTLAPGQDLERAIERLSKHADVERVERNYEVFAHATPNDPKFSQLWALHNIGQTGGTADADIDAPEAWDVATGSTDVVVAVVDTGIDYTHPDLVANMWTNPGEVPGNGIDDDGNGYVDDVHGYDFRNRDGNPFDDSGHGTHVAGTIAAAGDNGIGVVGVSWRARLMAVKFLGATGGGTTADAIRAITYAVDMGAVVINNSWGGGPYSQALLDAIRTTDAAGVLFVASAGNANSDNEILPTYPASYAVENLIAVAATDHADARASFSSWGASSVHLAAPGVAILSTVPAVGTVGIADPSRYHLLDGTSMAAPHVSGAAALLLSHLPGLGGREIKRRLMAGTDPIASMAGLTVTGGRLNIANLLSSDTVAPAGVVDLAATTASARRVSLSWTSPGGDGGAGQASLYDLRRSLAPIAEEGFEAATRVPFAPRPAPAGGGEALTVEGLEPATRYYFAVKTYDKAGNVSVISNVATADTADEAVIFRDAFETGAPGWTVDGSDGNGGPGLWHVSTVFATSPTHAFYYGREPQNTYYTAARNFGTLTSPPISLAGSVQSVLLFQQWLDNESRAGVDRARVLVSTDEGQTWAPAWTRFTRTGSGIDEIVVDLAAYDGQVIRVRFEFDTIDAYANTYRGWVVDDVVLAGSVAAGGNQPPVAAAGGPYSGLRHLPVTFDGSASADPDGDAISYRWDFGDGGVSFKPVTTHAYETTGTFEVRLTVNDGSRHSAPSVTTVTVTAPGPELVLHTTNDESGTGGVRVDPPNAVCDNPVIYASKDCYYYYEPGTVVTLTPIPGPNSTFLHWSGACSGSGPCQVTLTDDREVWAYFEGPQKTYVTVRSVGQGVGSVRVQAPDGTFDCVGTAGVDKTCLYQYPIGTVLTFTATADSLSYFQGWLESVPHMSCSGTGPCQYTVTEIVTLHAPFLGPRPLDVRADSVEGARGTVYVIDPPGSHSCTTDPPEPTYCTFLMKPGAAVTLAAVPEPGSRFLGWSGFCSGMGNCHLVMGTNTSSAPLSVATFGLNRPPTASPGGPYQGVRQQTLTFSGAGSSDPEGDALTYEWAFGDGASGAGVAPTHAYAALGTYTVTLTVRDTHGGSSSASTTATIVNRPPVANPGGPYSGRRRESVAFSGAASSDPDGDALTYEWTFGDGGTATGMSPAHVYAAAGTFTVTLRVTDAFGAAATASTTAVITK